MGSNLSGANLTNANLRATNLRKAFLIDSDLTYVDLSRADMSGANLCESNLNDATLNGAELLGVDFSGAELKGADFKGAIFGEVGIPYEFVKGEDSLKIRSTVSITKFIDVNMANVRNLHKSRFLGPSVINLQTFEKSGNLPSRFLQGCGLKNWEIEATKLYQSNEVI